MNIFQYFLSFIAMAMATVGMQAGLAAANLPTVFSSAEIVRDISYGPEAEQKLDLYIPPHAKGEKLSILVFFYGGRWTHGNKSQYAFVGDTFAKHNFIVAIPDYRKYPAVRFPTFVEDGAKAVAWIYDHIGEYGGDASRLHMAGHSAGAHIASLIVSDEHYLKAKGKQANKIIRSFVGLAGPYAFTPDEPDLIDMFGPPSNYPHMQTPTFIDGYEPPMFLTWGLDDTDVGRFNLEKLERRIKEKRGEVLTRLYLKTDHTGIIAGLTWLNPAHINVLQDMVQFFRSHESVRTGSPINSKAS